MRPRDGVTVSFETPGRGHSLIFDSGIYFFETPGRGMPRLRSNRGSPPAGRMRLLDQENSERSEEFFRKASFWLLVIFDEIFGKC